MLLGSVDSEVVTEVGRNLDFWAFGKCALQGRLGPILKSAILRDYGVLLGSVDTEAVTEVGRNLDFWAAGECALQGHERPFLESAVLRDYGVLLGELDSEVVTEVGRNLDFWAAGNERCNWVGEALSVLCLAGARYGKRRD